MEIIKTNSANVTIRRSWVYHEPVRRGVELVRGQGEKVVEEQSIVVLSVPQVHPKKLSGSGSLLMNTPHMIFHVVHSTKDSSASVPFTRDAGIVFRFVSCTVFLARETALARLRASVVSTEEVFAVTFVVFPKVATTGEDIS